jgi:hypothetical protein
MIFLVDVSVPETPHDLVQPVQADHSPIMQSSGQGTSLHFMVSMRGGHALPPYLGSVLGTRVRVLVPLAPQVAEQLPNLVQMEATQSIGHGRKLQALCAFMYGHALPPFSAFFVMGLVRVCEPVPQDFVHVE